MFYNKIKSITVRTLQHTIYTVSKKTRHQTLAKKVAHRLMTIILSNLNRLKNFTKRFPCKFVVKWVFKIPPFLVYVATLPCETLMSAKQATIDKLQGSVATYLRCNGVVNNQIKKGLLMSL